MVWIPGGEFSMGSTDESESMCGLPGVTQDALPVHRVYVDGFWMDATEITNNEYRQFVWWTRDSIAAKLMGYVKSVDGVDAIDWKKASTIKRISTKD